MSYATDAQGAFYTGPYHVFVILVASALLVSLVVARFRIGAVDIVRDPVVAMAVALSLVTVASSVHVGEPSDAVGTVSLLLAMVAVVVVVRLLGVEQRRLLVIGLVVLGVIVAMVGWAAVVARWQPDALTSQGLWRAASTLTYENALAAFVTPATLLCFDRLMAAPGDRRRPAAVTRRPATTWWSLGAYGLLVGVGASLSRGGLLGLAVGTVLLGLLRGPRHWGRVAPPVAGAVVALVCLAPSLPVQSATHVPLACAGLVLGAAIAVSTLRTARQRVGAAGAGAAALVILLVTAPLGHVASDIAQTRLSASSSDRAHEWASAFDLARHHLLLGVGTARFVLQWVSGGRAFTAYFAHNEYLQLLAQDGVVGLAVLVAGLAAVFVHLAHHRGQPTAWSADCGIACLAALLVQSAFDFLWHIPVIPELIAVALALSTTPGSHPAVPPGQAVPESKQCP